MIEISLNGDYYHRQVEIVAWCQKHFGHNFNNEVQNPREWRWSMRLAWGNQFYSFAKEQDAMFFTLKWGGTSTLKQDMNNKSITYVV